MSKRPYGQHFLIDPFAIQKIISSANLTKEDRVLEIGAGQGALTRSLCERAGQVVAFEIDEKLAALLPKLPNLVVVRQDFLQARLDEQLPGSGWKVVANLPYYITTPILERLLPAHDKVSEMWLMMQLEVAERIVSPASREAGSLTYFAQYYAEAEMVFKLPPGAFRPPPKVDSAVVHFKMRQQPLSERPKKLFALIRKAFHARRKMLGSTLKQDLSPEAFATAGVDPKRRPETLTLDEFLALERAAN